MALGRLADAELRTLKSEGHAVFDPLWKERKIFKSRKKAYEWLSEDMDLPIGKSFSASWNKLVDFLFIV